MANCIRRSSQKDTGITDENRRLEELVQIFLEKQKQSDAKIEKMLMEDYGTHSSQRWENMIPFTMSGVVDGCEERAELMTAQTLYFILGYTAGFTQGIGDTPKLYSALPLPERLRINLDPLDFPTPREFLLANTKQQVELIRWSYKQWCKYDDIIASANGRFLFAEDICNVRKEFGDSLPYAGATYGYAFTKWFREREPTMYKSWLSEIGEQKSLMQMRIGGEAFLGLFTFTGLGRRIAPSTQNEYLAAFCNEHKPAYTHIQNLLEEVAFMQTTPVTSSDIRNVMEGYGESLSDLGATYQHAFVEWFRVAEPDIYLSWLDDLQAHESTDIPQQEIESSLLFEFSNNTLDGRVYDKHDEYLAEFCSTNPEANSHILTLLDSLEERE